MWKTSLCPQGVCSRALLPALSSTGLLSQSLEFSSPADNYTVCEGDNATLSCFIDEHVTRVAWLNRSNILYAGNDRWTSDPRVRLLINTPEEFSILITQVGLGDEGLYTCSFQTRHQPYTTQVYLIVHVPARIVNISSPVTVNEGGSVNLLCLAVGRPEPTVTWRQLRDGFTSEGEILEISDIQRGQAGEYECVTHNGVNSAPDSRRVLVTVNYPPTITDVTSARTALGRAALLRCEAMAVPPADFQWYKDDRLPRIPGELSPEAPGAAGPALRPGLAVVEDVGAARGLPLQGASGQEQEEKGEPAPWVSSGQKSSQPPRRTRGRGGGGGSLENPSL
ncbi:igLON family member 5 isoform X1 [Marmota marmota marmota]|uniref:igLON family member 5 isoform X1 n=1 Tax=Marmota marmota marmota TaxID=9994 RepID=UPI0020933E5D|nr:igLON family member 5 isoform X1 [Marmota marmota marmota]